MITFFGIRHFTWKNPAGDLSWKKFFFYETKYIQAQAQVLHYIYYTVMCRGIGDLHGDVKYYYYWNALETFFSISISASCFINLQSDYKFKYKR